MDHDRERRLATAAWAVSGAFGPVIPLVLFALHHRSSKFVAYHTLQAALSYVALIAIAVVAGLLMGVGTLIAVVQGGLPGPGATPPPLVQWTATIAALMAGSAYIGLVVMSLRFALRVHRGEPAHYPIVHRLASHLAEPPARDEGSA